MYTIVYKINFISSSNTKIMHFTYYNIMTYYGLHELHHGPPICHPR